MLIQWDFLKLNDIIWLLLKRYTYKMKITLLCRPSLQQYKVRSKPILAGVLVGRMPIKIRASCFEEKDKTLIFINFLN